MNHNRNHNFNNNGRNFLNGRLMVTVVGFVLTGLLYNIYLVHDQLMHTGFFNEGSVMDDPRTPMVHVERRTMNNENENGESNGDENKEQESNDKEVTEESGEENESGEEKNGDENKEQESNDKEVTEESGEENKSGEEKEENESGEEKEENESGEEESKPYVEPEECKKKTKRMNVALFYADDWTMKVLGKLDKNVKTPNIDAMADNGMIFTNNCVTTSVCWVSRATLLTGTYSAIHQHSFPYDEGLFEDRKWSDTLFSLMRKGSGSSGPACRDGYYTGLFGKWHKMEYENQRKEAFDEMLVYYGNHWEKRDGKLQHVTELNKEDSIKFLTNWQEKFGDKEEKTPFFLTTSFFATHARDGELPSYQPKNNTRLNIYPDSIQIPPPKTATEDHYLRLPRFLIDGQNEGRTRWKNRFEPKDFQKNIKDIYAMATEVDEAVGAIVEKIKSVGALDDTILIFTTDNGNLHGEHGLAEKWYPFEESMRVPLVIQDPRMPKNRRGTMSDAWTLNIDLAPTILGAANIAPSDFMQGRDIADLYLNTHDEQASLSVDELKEKVEWRKEWFYEFNLGKNNNASDHPWEGFIDSSFALVNDEWKYVVWPQHNYEQLFHRSVDPFDEWDLLDKILRQKSARLDEAAATNIGLTQSRKMRGVDNKNGCCDTIQTTTKMYTEMKERFAVLKERAQRGERV